MIALVEVPQVSSIIQVYKFCLTKWANQNGNINLSKQIGLMTMLKN